MKLPPAAGYLLASAYLSGLAWLYAALDQPVAAFLVGSAAVAIGLAGGRLLATPVRSDAGDRYPERGQPSAASVPRTSVT